MKLTPEDRRDIKIIVLIGLVLFAIAILYMAVTHAAPYCSYGPGCAG
jgi:hypothetical protein